MIYLVIVLMAAQTFVLIMLARNNQVHERRHVALMNAYDLARQDVDSGERSWRRHYAGIESIGYNRMLLCFWRPVSSWDKQLGITENEETSS